MQVGRTGVEDTGRHVGVDQRVTISVSHANNHQRASATEEVQNNQGHEMTLPMAMGQPLSLHTPVLARWVQWPQSKDASGPAWTQWPDCPYPSPSQVQLGTSSSEFQPSRWVTLERLLRVTTRGH